MATKIQVRRGLASEWSSSNPVLSEGEIGFERDTFKFKLGDGATAWNSLTYTVTKTIAGLSNVDNTSDAAKPVSTATQTALNAKAATSHTHGVTELTATGTRSATTYLRGDNTWGTPGTSGTSAVPRLGFTLVAANDAPADVKAQADYVCGTTANQNEINSALTAMATTGGLVQLAGNVFNLTGAVQLRTATTLQGYSKSTQLKAVSGFNTGMVTLFDDTVHLTELCRMTLDGNGQAVHGMEYSASGGQVFTSTPSSNPDPSHEAHHLYIKSCGTATFPGYGMLLAGGNLRAGKYDTMRILGVSGCGVFINGSVDSHFTNIEIGSSGNSGTYSTSTTAPVGGGFVMENSANNMFTACKAWYSRGAGFYVRGTRNGFVNCQAQDNYSYGFQNLYGKNIYSNCISDSNGQANGADARGRTGFYLSGDSVSVTGCQSFDKQESTTTAWWQQQGFQLSSGLTYSRVIGCTTYGNELAASTGTAGTGTTVDIQGDSAGK